MEEKIPIIISATLTPNPALVGQPVRISIAAAELETNPTAFAWPCGQVSCGVM